MSLTYQPFSETPEIRELGANLEMNLPASERLGSVLVGVGVVAALISPKRIGRLGLLAVGAAFIWRGMAGRCPWYNRIGVDRRHGI